MTTKRRVKGFPLSQLWFNEQDISSRRLRDLSRDEADSLIMERDAGVVIAQVGAPLLWPRHESVQSFWKRTPKSGYYHTAQSHDEVLGKSSKPNYIFYASEWESFEGLPLVLLESVCWPYDPALEMF